ncbi:MBG domain-containing protein [Stenotrophomonas sp. MH1]|uniref:MBG domain-containing protein n=1 Tax=Stenotrophomonas capsici TaxID=3110230 RepID=A0ABU5V0W4_9GAMM|nr:MBG domain-containing protein [Stenotrophomonas sp. MH1]MEA5666984.1 MBG domain-containing protein [Stenotrophomonas sp. MH1]
MNRIYRLVYNTALGLVQVASEHGTALSRRSRSNTDRQRHALVSSVAGAVLFAIVCQASAQNLPQNGNIVAGSASINVNGNVMTIDQTSQAALINWSSFDIGAGNKVQFNQGLGSQATAINLVTGSSGSLISGELSSNGQVFLINPAGITFTSGASVNVGGLLASTLSPGTPGLLDANGVSPTFQLAGGGTGAVVSNNGGTLSAASGGISLIGGAVSNTGIISAANGNINLVAAGAAMVLNGVSSSGSPQLRFLPTSVGTFAGTGINNSGVLSARSISMNALMGPGLSSTGINAGGTIIANAIDAGDGSLTIRSSAPVALSNAAITAGSVAVAGASVVGPVAIQMADGSIQASTVAFDGGPSGNVMLGGGIKADTISIAANNAVQTAGGTLEGALSLATQGGATLGQSGNRIGSVGGSVGADLTLATSTDLSNGGALLVGGSSVIEAGSSNITLTNSGNSFGNGVSAHGGDITLASGGVLGLGNINARSLAVQAGSIDLGGTVITTGDQTYQSAVTLRGNSALQGSAIQFNGTVDGSYQLAVDSSGMTTFSSAVGGSTALQGLRVTSGTGTRLFGDITTMGTLAFDGAVRVSGARSLSSLGGSLRFGGTLDGDGGTLNLSARQLTLGGAVGGAGPVGRLYGHADSITLGSRIASTGAILLEGDVRLDGNTQLVSTGGGAITTDGISSDITNGYNLLMSTTGQVQVNGNISAADVSITGQLFNGRGIASKGNLDIDSALTLVQMGSYQVDGWARFRSLGDISLADAGNRFSGEVSLSGRSAQLRAGDLQLGNTLLSDNLQLDLSGFLQQAAGSVVDIGGTTRIDAGGFVSLNRVDGVGRPVNLFGGAVSLKGGNSNISASGTLAFSHFDVASLWTIADVVQLPASGTSIGLQYFQGNVVLTGDSVLDSQLGQINFRGPIDGPHALTLTSGLNVVFAGDVGGTQALASLEVGGAGPLQLGGNITTNGAIRLGNVNLAASTPRWFNIRSNNGGVVIGRIDGSSDGRSSLALDAHGTLELQSGAGTTAGAWLTDLELKGSSVTTKAIRTTGRLDVTSSAGFTQGGAFTVGGDASFTAGLTGDLTLDAYPNTFSGKVALRGAQARIQALSGLMLDGVDTATLDAYSVGVMSLANANVANAASLNSASLLFDDASIGGVLQATARSGGITQQGALRVSGNSNWLASGEIRLDNVANQFAGRVDAQSGTTTELAAANLLQLGDVIATGLRANATAGLQLAGRVSADTVELATAGRFDNVTGADAIALNGTGNWRIYLASPSLGHAFNGLDSGNTALWNTPAFAGTAASGNRYVFAFQPTLTLSANNLHKVYGDHVDLSNAFSVQGAMAGAPGAYKADDVRALFTSVPVLSSAGAGVTAKVTGLPYSIDLVAGSADVSAAGYLLNFVPGQLFIDQKALTITAGNAGKTYGQTSPLGGFSVAGLVNGDTVSGLDLLSSGSAVTANAGDYTITAGNASGTGLGNYAITYVDGLLSVGKATLTITAGNGSKTYGQALSLGSYTVDGLVNGDTVSGLDLLSNGSAVTANAGDYTITAGNASGTGLGNYTIAYVDGLLSVGKATLTITAGNGSKIYGQDGGFGNYSVDGLLNSDAVASVMLGSDGAATHASVGQYAIHAGDARGTGLGNYAITYVDGLLSVGKATLTITAGNGSKIYGQGGGFGNYSVDGLLNSDAVASVMLGSDGAAANATVGHYAIHAGDARGTGLGNYTITYVDGQMSVGKANLVITARDASKRMGQALLLDGYTVEGLLNGDRVEGLDLSSDGSAANAEPGRYAILASAARGNRLANYAISYQEGTLDVSGIASEVQARIAREIAANAARPGSRVPTGPAVDAPLYRAIGEGIARPGDACVHMGDIRCLSHQPE